jgi:hypothetical protein
MTFPALARAGRTDGQGPPQHVEAEFRRCLECGSLAHAFARARCGQRGHDFLMGSRWRCFAQRRGTRPPATLGRLLPACIDDARRAFAPNRNSVVPLQCHHCGGPARVLAFITQAPSA